MKNIQAAFAAFLVFGSLIGLSFVSNVADNYKVDTSASIVNWKAYKVTGQHNGSVNLKSGAFQFTDGKLTGGSFEIDVTTIKVLDMQGDMAGKLEGHLKSDDFFSAAKNPTSTFVITKVASRGTPGNYRVTGNLTIKGITKEVKFDATLNVVDGKATGEAFMKIDRTDFNIQYRSGNFFENLGDKTIYDEFDLNVVISAAKA
ncbi:MAG: YceI family protein [Lewinellaceae bacterium]|nr:YceI family protein [Lewinellaceae bacterium]